VTRSQVEERLTQLIHREPYEPFIIELKNGERLEILDRVSRSITPAEGSSAQKARWSIFGSRMYDTSAR
jgi:hypothetical protein